ncbi:MAG TPA: hypothetical protein VKU44_09390, partial [Terriglobia bacterium]|nr:hypothetical protein [Terriglobia bacterium]
MPVTELRPLSLGELLDRTFSYYRQHFWLFIGIMAVPQVLNVALSLGLQVVTHPGTSPPVTNGDPTEILRQLAPVLAVSVIVLIIVLVGSFLIYSVALGATTNALSDVHLGRTATVKSAYQSLKGKVGRLFGLTFLVLFIAFGVYIGLVIVVVFLGLGLGLLLRAVAPAAGFLLPIVVGAVTALAIVVSLVFGLIFLLRYALAVPALVLENLAIRQALKRSAFLTQGYKGQVFVIALLMYVVTGVVGVVFQAPFLVAGLVLGFKFGVMPLWLRVPYAISAGAGGALAGPFLMIGLALAYYDTRVRKEGFDLQLMVAALGPASPAP